MNLTVPGWLVAGPSAYQGEPDEVDVSGTIAMDAETLSERLGYSDSECAAIVLVIKRDEIAKRLAQQGLGPMPPPAPLPKVPGQLALRFDDFE